MPRKKAEPVEEKPKPRTVPLTDAVWDGLDQLAQSRGLRRTVLINEIFRHALNPAVISLPEQEDLEAIKERFLESGGSSEITILPTVHELEECKTAVRDALDKGTIKPKDVVPARFFGQPRKVVRSSRPSQTDKVHTYFKNEKNQ